MTKILKRFFWLALLLHLLLFLGFSLTLQLSPDEILPFEKQSDRYLPAYLYQEKSQAPHSSASQAQASQIKPAPLEPEKKVMDTIAIKKKELKKNRISQRAETRSQSALPFLEAESPKSGKPIDEPLLKELTRATAAKLYYPAEAAAFHIKGKVTVRFLLYPDGRVLEVRVVESSGFRILDDAALNTIRSISPVRDANLYLTQPRYIHAGILFG